MGKQAERLEKHVFHASQQPGQSLIAGAVAREHIREQHGGDGSGGDHNPKKPKNHDPKPGRFAPMWAHIRRGLLKPRDVGCALALAVAITFLGCATGEATGTPNATHESATVGSTFSSVSSTTSALEARILAFANVTPGVIAEWNTAIHEENVLTAACVKRETGLNMPADSGKLPVYWVDGASLQWQELTVAQARRRGFGVWLQYVTQPPSPLSLWLASLSAKQQQLFNKAMAAGSMRFITVPTYDGNTAFVGATGCLAMARKQLYGSLRAADQALSLFHLGLDLSSHFMQEPVWHSRDKPWNLCMANNGYANVSIDTIISKLVTPLYASGRVTAAAKAREEKIATATARCEASTGIIDAHLRAEQLVVQRFTPTDLVFFRSAIAASDAAAHYTLSSR